MRQCLAAVLVLTAASLTGCFTAPPDRSICRYTAQVPFTSLTGDDVVQLDVYLVERPVADRCINRDVWELSDEEVLQEKKSLLEDNGFRACLLGDAPPDGLRALLRSERSCANPRRLRLHSGKPTQVVLSPTLPQVHFVLRQDGRKTDVDLDQAQCLLQVTTRVADDGRLVLQFTPQVRHGEPVVTPRPVQDPSGTLHWDVQTDQPTESYRGLSWELTVAPNTYVAVGTLLEGDDTLGRGAFLTTEGARTQRLLVLRASRALGTNGPKNEMNGRAPPLALQAAWTSARGAGP